MAYPSVVATLTNPLSTQQLNSPSHSTIETNQNTEVVAIETFVGTLAGTPGTLLYDIRSAASSGGGHVQAANTGGTGQTAFAKGDMLVASSSSVLTKLGVGADNLVLTADSTQGTGVNWKGVGISYKNGTATRLGNTASGTQTIAHGLGVVPKSVRVTAEYNIAAGAEIINSTGVYNGTTTSCIRNGWTGARQDTNLDTTNIINLAFNGTDSQVATVTVDSTNISLGWTMTGTLNSNSMFIMWEAMG